MILKNLKLHAWGKVYVEVVCMWVWGVGMGVGMSVGIACVCMCPANSHLVSSAHAPVCHRGTS